MIELAINQLCKYYGATLIFENISFDLKTKERLALIGSNGVGKSTLLKMIIGEEFGTGTISIRKNASVGYLDQLPTFPENYTVKEVLQLAFSDLLVLESDMRKLELSFPNLQATDLEVSMDKYSRLQLAFESKGGYDMQAQFGKITTGLEIPPSMLALPFNSLSGGEKTRVILGKILLESPDILLLDEPSNHLDLRALHWLETYLADYKGSVLIVSHDRYFLDKVANKIVELTPYSAEIYEGNYSYYVEEKQRRMDLLVKEYNQQQKQIKRMQEQIERYRIWGEMRDSDKMYRRAKELEKRLEKVEVMDKPQTTKANIKIDYGHTERSGKEVLIVNELSKSFPDNPLFSNLSLILFYKNRLALMGDNGCGKSTFLKIILGSMEADYGTARLGSKVKVGYLPQEIYFENETLSVLEFFQRQFNLDAGTARKALAKMLFIKDDVFKTIQSLSGGEKSRLKLCCLMHESVNFLILDEPTNHLDIESREILEESLLNFEGSILFVSHDRYFINKIALTVGAFENKELKLYDGDYEYYQSELEKFQLLATPESKSSKSTVSQAQSQDFDLKNMAKKEIKKQSQQIERLENEIQTLELAIESLDIEMSQNSNQIRRLTELHNEKVTYEVRLEALLEEWESLQESLVSLRSELEIDL